MAIIITRLENGNVEIDNNGVKGIASPLLLAQRKEDSVLMVNANGSIIHTFKTSDVEKTILSDGTVIDITTTLGLYNSLKNNIFFKKAPTSGTGTGLTPGQAAKVANLPINTIQELLEKVPFYVPGTIYASGFFVFNKTLKKVYESNKRTSSTFILDEWDFVDLSSTENHLTPEQAAKIANLPNNTNQELLNKVPFYVPGTIYASGFFVFNKTLKKVYESNKRTSSTFILDEWDFVDLSSTENHLTPEQAAKIANLPNNTNQELLNKVPFYVSGKVYVSGFFVFHKTLKKVYESNKITSSTFIPDEWDFVDLSSTENHLTPEQAEKIANLPNNTNQELLNKVPFYVSGKVYVSGFFVFHKTLKKVYESNKITSSTFIPDEWDFVDLGDGSGTGLTPEQAAKIANLPNNTNQELLNKVPFYVPGKVYASGFFVFNKTLKKVYESNKGTSSTFILDEWDFVDLGDGSGSGLTPEQAEKIANLPNNTNQELLNKVPFYVPGTIYPAGFIVFHKTLKKVYESKKRTLSFFIFEEWEVIDLGSGTGLTPEQAEKIANLPNNTNQELLEKVPFYVPDTIYPADFIVFHKTLKKVYESNKGTSSTFIPDEWDLVDLGDDSGGSSDFSFLDTESTFDSPINFQFTNDGSDFQSGRVHINTVDNVDYYYFYYAKTDNVTRTFFTNNVGTKGANVILTNDDGGSQILFDVGLHRELTNDARIDSYLIGATESKPRSFLKVGDNLSVKIVIAPNDEKRLYKTGSGLSILTEEESIKRFQSKNSNPRLIESGIDVGLKRLIINSIVYNVDSVTGSTLTISSGLPYDLLIGDFLDDVGSYYIGQLSSIGANKETYTIEVYDSLTLQPSPENVSGLFPRGKQFNFYRAGDFMQAFILPTIVITENFRKLVFSKIGYQQLIIDLPAGNLLSTIKSGVLTSTKIFQNASVISLNVFDTGSIGLRLGSVYYIKWSGNISTQNGNSANITFSLSGRDLVIFGAVLPTGYQTISFLYHVDIRGENLGFLLKFFSDNAKDNVILFNNNLLYYQVR